MERDSACGWGLESFLFLFFLNERMSRRRQWWRIVVSGLDV